MTDGLYTAREAADSLGMTPEAVSMWSSRGWVNEHGELQKLTRHGSRPALFLWSELVLAERDTRRKRNRSHQRGKKRVAA